MDVTHADAGLASAEQDASATVGHGDAVDRGFRKVMQVIRQALDERDLYAMKSLRCEKLEGHPDNVRSLRINKQWRLIVEIRGVSPNKNIGVLRVEDYH